MRLPITRDADGTSARQYVMRWTLEANVKLEIVVDDVKQPDDNKT